MLEFLAIAVVVWLVYGSLSRARADATEARRLAEHETRRRVHAEALAEWQRRRDKAYREFNHAWDAQLDHDTAAGPGAEAGDLPEYHAAKVRLDAIDAERPRILH